MAIGGGAVWPLRSGFSALTSLGCGLLLTPDARLFVMLAPACFGEDAVLLNTLRKALEGGLERFVVPDDYFGQPYLR
jgi:hypothetical protein